MQDTFKTATFMKRLGAMFYDFMLALSFVILAGFLFTAVLMSILNIENVQPGTPVAKIIFILTSLVAFGFYGWFWTHGGQTLGMRAWKLKLVRSDGETVTWLQAFFRFCYSIISWLPLGAGYLWMLVDKHKLSWHDRASKTYIIDLK
jgi:uncharacterized RDD family membrane protein YckC